MNQLCFILYWKRFGNLSLCLKILQPLSFSRVRNCSSQVPWSESPSVEGLSVRQRGKPFSKSHCSSHTTVQLPFFLLPLGSVQALPWIRWWERALPDFVLALSPGSGPHLLWQLHPLSLCRADGLECKQQWFSVVAITSWKCRGFLVLQGHQTQDERECEMAETHSGAESDPFLSVCFRVTC